MIVNVVAGVLAVLALVLMLPAAATATDGPQPPCASTPAPAFPSVADPPNVRLWSADELGTDWRLPPCTGWSDLAFDQLIGLAGRFRLPDDGREMLERFGQISQLTSIRYWSVSRETCRDLIDVAFALSGPDTDQRRSDFSAQELAAGKSLYFFQDDNGPGSGAVYRLRVHDVLPDRLIVETENISSVRIFLLPLFKPGELRALYFLDRDASGIWSFYSLTGTTEGASSIAGGHETSYVNRALALYGHVARIEPCTNSLRAGQGNPNVNSD